MLIKEILAGGKPSFSFEFFPPKTEEDTKDFYGVLKDLKTLEPDFISVTHSATGIAPLKTAALALLIKDRFQIEPMTHFTCIAHSRDEVRTIAAQIKASGIKNVLALRGDLQPDTELKGEYSHALDLVLDLKKLGDFCIGVAGYPEKHPEAASMDLDIANLKRKVDAGASFIITQLFFINKSYYAFVDKCRRAGISVPIIPGIMPVGRYSQLEKFALMCGTQIPEGMKSYLEQIKEDHPAVMEYGINYAIEQCRDLLRHGAPGIHFYTFNKSKATMAIMRELKKEFRP